MIELRNKQLINKKNEVDELIKFANRNINKREDYEKALDKAIDEYIKYFIQVLNNIDKQIDNIFKAEYIIDKKYQLSSYIKELLVKIEKDLNKKLVKSKLTNDELSEIKRILKRIKDIKQEVSIHNSKKLKEQYKLFYNKYSELIKQKYSIDEKEINIVKEMCSKCINLYDDKEIIYQCEKIYEEILFIETIIKEYINIPNFFNKVNNIIDDIKHIKSFKTLLNYEDIKQLIRDSKKLEHIINNDLIYGENLFNDKESIIIKNAKSSVNNLEIIIGKYYDFLKQKSKDIINYILIDLYSSQIELYKFIDSHDYIDINLRDSILKIEELNYKLEELRKTENVLIIDRVKIDINKYIDIFNNKIDNHNIKFVLSEKNKYANFFRNIEQKALDNQQIEAILKDEYNNLVIAGAGCGKTITILGKILYILEKGLCTSDEILVISFTNATTDELKERIDKLTKENVQVTNFHKLGLNIIKTVQQDNISILSDRYNTIVNIVYKLSKEDKFRNMLETYIVEYYSYENIEEVFNSFGDYVKYYAQRKDILYTIKGERVKSFEEKQIANYLYINGIEYEYEKEYKYNTKNESYKNQYKPDFYLPEYDMYIEHFGVDKYMKPPRFYSKEDKYKYIKGMEWKFRIHKSKNTKLIATYSWEYKEKILLKSLEVKLKKHGVKLDRLSEAKLNDIIKTKFKDFLETLERIINIIKMQGKTIEQVREVNDSIAFIDSYNYSKNELLLDIVEYVYDEYSEYLSKNNKLDFVDMVKKATDYIESGKYTKKYKYIIIDEYQDISTDRVKLIKALREINDAKLFCVGDDWQSIYRFAGSDVSFFTEFENTFGYTEKSKIENTYRFGDNVIKLSEKFIQTNPNQIKKKLKSSQNKKTDICICSYNVENKYVLLEDILSKIPKESKVLLLDRYDEYRYQIKVKKVIDNIKNKYKKDLKIVYKTIHQSKGLEADYVVVLNNTNKIKGFPSKIENENLIDLILEKEEKYPFEEERRLFYVAMTRCKKGLFFMVDYDIKSEFIMEIEGDKSIKFDNRYYKSRYVCPKCFIGILEEKNSNSKIINICSNYPICNYIEDIPKI